jgi:hypothetical protein
MMTNQTKRVKGKKLDPRYVWAVKFVAGLLTYDATHPKFGKGSNRSMWTMKLYRKLRQTKK